MRKILYMLICVLPSAGYIYAQEISEGKMQRQLDEHERRLAQQRKEKEFNGLLSELNRKNKRVNDVYSQIEKCEMSANKTAEQQKADCGNKPPDVFIADRYSFLKYAVKEHLIAKKNYDDFNVKNNPETRSVNGGTDPRIIDVRKAMDYYTNPVSPSQTPGNSSSTNTSAILKANIGETLEERVAGLEKEIKRLKEFIRKNIGENKNSICQKVSTCPQISRLKDKVDAINVIADPQDENSSGGGLKPQTPMNQ